MGRRTAGWVLAVAWVQAAPVPGAAQPADVVLRGGAVYTMDAVRSWARAVAISKGRIAFVGTDAGVEAFVGPHTKVIELGGRMALPGFQDAHIHAISSGVGLGQCDLAGSASEVALLERIRACVREHPGQGWIQGGGWSMAAFKGGVPTRAALDAVAPDRPVYLTSADGHTAWVNSVGLERAGLTASSSDPPGGRIERDERTGEPGGALQEDAAMLLVGRLVPEADLAECRRGLAAALALLHRNGVTAFQEPLSQSSPPVGRGALEVYRDAEEHGVLSAKVAVALDTDPRRGPEQVDDLVRLRREFSSRRVSPSSAKIFVDGIVESHTAAMLEPYADRPAERGELLWSVEGLRALVRRLGGEGFGIHVHAIGDRAIRTALDAFEEGGLAQGKARLQIAHVEVVHPRDIPRFRSLHVIANFQPLWAFEDSYVRDLTWPALGPERSAWLYPIGSIQRSGGLLAFGSDWSVSSLNPLEGIQVAVTRLGPGGSPGEPLLPGEAIDLPTALAAYTIGSAYANGLEGETGSLEVGKAADLVVLSANLFEIPPREIARTRVLLTLADGEAVYRDPSFAW